VEAGNVKLPLDEDVVASGNWNDGFSWVVSTTLVAVEGREPFENAEVPELSNPFELSCVLV